MHGFSSTALRIASLLIVGLLAGTVSQVWGSETVAEEGTFTGSWSLQGTARAIEVESEELALFRLEGPVTIRSSGGLATQFEAECVGVSNRNTGGVGRCVWTDEAGEQIYLEISGSVVGPRGTSREAEGNVIGGTGRYHGIEGGFRMDWLFVESRLEDDKFKGYVTKLEGDWRRVTPPSP